MKTLYCPCCAQPMHTYEQTMYRADKTTYTTVCAECHNPKCPMHNKTASEQYLLDGSFIERWNAGILEYNAKRGENKPLIVARFDVKTGNPLAMVA